MPATDPDDLRGLEQALWALLALRSTSEQRRHLIARLLSSPELENIRRTWKNGRMSPADGATGGPAPPPRGSDEAFVRLAYQFLLARPADEGGLRHYTSALAAGEPRESVLGSLMLSEEFDRRARGVPADAQLCELANPAKWDNAEWLDILRSLGLADDKLSMHRKPYEFTQLVFGCRRLGALRADSTIVSVGAGHEIVLYWLANHARQVIATDRYEGVWRDLQGREGDPDVLKDPAAYAPFAYRREHLIFMKMDGRRLAFRTGTFDIAYSLSSIEHFGGPSGALETIREMGRVVKPGGIVAVATEYVLHGPPHQETFQPEEIAALVDQSGLELVEPIDDGVYRRYEYAPVDLYQDPYQTPHMVVRFGDTVFTTVMVFLRKAPDSGP